MYDLINQAAPPTTADQHDLTKNNNTHNDNEYQEDTSLDFIKQAFEEQSKP